MTIKMRILGLAIVLVASAGLSTSGWAQTDTSGEKMNESSPPVAEPKEGASEYWTEERLRSAKPLEPPSVSQEELQKLLSEENQKKSERNDLIEIPGADLSTLGVPSDADIAQIPYKHSGKLFFTKGSSNYSCTAQFVGDTTVLLTAAHCVRDENSGAWATNVIFLRGFNSGSAQQRVGTLCLSTKQGWVTGGSGRYKWDYAFIKTQGASASGYFALTTGLPTSTWEAIGYPSNFASGQKLQKVVGNKGAVGGGVVQMVGNPMRSGNSGGAWHTGGAATGNNSYHVNGNTTDEWSPYYDANTANLWQYAKNGCK